MKRPGKRPEKPQQEKGEKRWQPPRVVLQPEVQQGMQAGINKIVDVICPTLGPRPRVAALQKVAGSRYAPEMLDDGGTIARRIVQLPDRDEDVGAMYVRQVLWQLYEMVGDGVATAAVIFKEVYNQGLRYLASGGNAMRLRKYLEEGIRFIFHELDGMTLPLEGKEALIHMAESICYDPPLAALIGEIFDVIGSYGRLEIRTNPTDKLEREYVEGLYWESGILSRSMFTDPGKLRAELDDATILVTDLALEEPRDLFNVLALVAKEKIGTLLIVAKRISDAGIGLLTSKELRERIKVVAVRTPTAKIKFQTEEMFDLAILTGARPFLENAGDTLRMVRLEDLGRARKVWADRSFFGISGGQGDPRKLREHIAALRSALGREGDPGEREKLEYRLGKLISGSAILKIGAFTETEMETRKELAARTTSAMRAAMREGVLPGGGSALLACRPVLQQRLEQCQDVDERAAYRILIQAVEAPFRTLLKNAGLDPNVLLKEIEQVGPGYGYDILAGRVVDMAQAGIFDPTVVEKAAVRSGIGGAALALTTDVIIHRAAAPEEFQT